MIYSSVESFPLSFNLQSHHWGYAHMDWDWATSNQPIFMPASPIFMRVILPTYVMSYYTLSLYWCLLCLCLFHLEIFFNVRLHILCHYLSLKNYFGRSSQLFDVHLPIRKTILLHHNNNVIHNNDDIINFIGYWFPRKVNKTLITEYCINILLALPGLFGSGQAWI